jgi:AhpD family alkylhydroperoxidase
MTPRLDPYAASPTSLKAMYALEAQVRASGLETSLVELVKLRASQINGCTYCMHMHATDARKAGESEERLFVLSGWPESPLFTDRERAALAWTEALTRLAETHAPDDLYAKLAEHFSAEEQVKLTLLIATINAWNRFGVGFKLVHPVSADAAAA